jgi:hypothetical protein
MSQRRVVVVRCRDAACPFSLFVWAASARFAFVVSKFQDAEWGHQTRRCGDHGQLRPKQPSHQSRPSTGRCLEKFTSNVIFLPVLHSPVCPLARVCKTLFYDPTSPWPIDLFDWDSADDIFLVGPGVCVC